MGTRKSPLEDSVENYLVDRVKELGGIALKGDIKGQRFLDRIIILPGGRTVWCECKRPENGRYSKHQTETLKRLGELGHEVLRVHTKSMVDLFIAHSAEPAETPPPSTHLAALEKEIKDLKHDLASAEGRAKNATSNYDYWKEQYEVLAKGTPSPETRTP